MNAAGLSSTALLLLVGVACSPNAGLCGRIKGKVVVAGPVSGLKKVDVTIDQYICGNAKESEELIVSPQKELKNAVVWLDNPPAQSTAPALPAKVEMDQSKCVFIPHIVIVPAGGTVDFLNSDRLLHNLHTTPKINPPSIARSLRSARSGSRLRSRRSFVSTAICKLRRRRAPLLHGHRSRSSVRLRQCSTGPVQAEHLP